MQTNFYYSIADNGSQNILLHSLNISFDYQDQDQNGNSKLKNILNNWEAIHEFWKL